MGAKVNCEQSTKSVNKMLPEYGVTILIARITKDNKDNGDKEQVNRFLHRSVEQVNRFLNRMPNLKEDPFTTNLEYIKLYLSKYEGGEIVLSKEYWEEGIALICLSHQEKRNAISGMGHFQNTPTTPHFKPRPPKMGPPLRFPGTFSRYGVTILIARITKDNKDNEDKEQVNRFLNR
ncbi:hypothetical protein NQ317_002341 [Molorchus minor]|uniref:Uncharacterized protein n=1 Tax=Molorchus minor TaxID=1323400 RepID=A0ABQ9IR46_9CUCU|nr:hypothetical protein NQ317_002341 [Molorchus minor]